MCKYLMRGNKEKGTGLQTLLSRAQWKENIRKVVLMLVVEPQLQRHSKPIAYGPGHPAVGVPV